MSRFPLRALGGRRDALLGSLGRLGGPARRPFGISGPPWGLFGVLSGDPKRVWSPGGAIQREGDTTWSSELGLEGLFRERETPSGPQNWGWRGYSERGRHQVVHRIGVGSCC